MYSSPYWIVLAVCSIAFTATAAVIDYRTQRIPNKLTLPMFAAGWIFQLALNPAGPLSGLVDGLTGFAIGFGMFFILWIIGGGGGGDAKLVGALSVWLGFWKTFGLIVVSTLLVVLGTGLLMLYGMFTKGVYRTKREFMPPQKNDKKKKGPLELLQFNRGRKGMTYGLSVAIATVLIVSTGPAIEHRRKLKSEQNAADAEAKKAAETPAGENDELNVESPETPKTKSEDKVTSKPVDKTPPGKSGAAQNDKPKSETKTESKTKTETAP
ncbi:MAG: Type leader peptidase family protein [Planctomycetaceae bacterium]|nr:Type leader peptidase family protein [Planctomycetaceae bacterium]